jgi:hypothetical protein
MEMDKREVWEGIAQGAKAHREAYSSRGISGWAEDKRRTGKVQEVKHLCAGDLLPTSCKKADDKESMQLYSIAYKGEG